MIMRIVSSDRHQARLHSWQAILGRQAGYSGPPEFDADTVGTFWAVRVK